MKRSTFLTALSILPILLASCKKPLPTSATIVKGNLVDENNNPIEGIHFRFSGYYYKGISPISTFGETLVTDIQGSFRFEKIVTSPTEYVEFAPNENYIDKVFMIKIQDGTFIQGGDVQIGIGKENIFNFKLVKR